jgi:hypothetical protein
MMNWSNDAGINMSKPQMTDKRPVNLSEVGIRCAAPGWLVFKITEGVKERSRTDLLQDDEVVL